MRVSAGALQTEKLIIEENCVALKAELVVLSKMLTSLVRGADRKG
jgi:hypothetical protein